MGNICFWDPDSQYFDSSILIRTLCLHASSDYQFAAGSGLTINSLPHSEWEEINAKASVVVRY